MAKTKIMKTKFAYFSIALILTSCTSQRLVTGTRVKKESPVYLSGVLTMVVGIAILMSIKFKEQ